MCAHAREESGRNHINTCLYFGVNDDAPYRRTSYSTAAHGLRLVELPGVCADGLLFYFVRLLECKWTLPRLSSPWLLSFCARASPAHPFPLAGPHLDADYPSGLPAGLTPAASAWSGPGASPATSLAAAQPWSHHHCPSWPALHCRRGGGGPGEPQGWRGSGRERERNWILAMHWGGRPWRWSLEA